MKAVYKNTAEDLINPHFLVLYNYLVKPIGADI